MQLYAVVVGPVDVTQQHVIVSYVHFIKLVLPPLVVNVISKNLVLFLTSNMGLDG